MTLAPYDSSVAYQDSSTAPDSRRMSVSEWDNAAITSPGGGYETGVMSRRMYELFELNRHREADVNRLVLCGQEGSANFLTVQGTMLGSKAVLDFLPEIQSIVGWPFKKDPRTQESVSGYVLPEGRGPVLQFIAENPFLRPLLPKVADQLRNHFPDSKLSVSLDVDEESSTEELAVEVFTDLAPDAALDALNAFDAEWWLDHMDEAKCKLYITLRGK